MLSLKESGASTKFFIILFKLFLVETITDLSLKIIKNRMDPKVLRLNLGQNAPELYKKVVELDALAMKKIIEANISEGFAHLLKLRASQINQCAFCIRLHTHDALQANESIERISLLNAWADSLYFNEQECAALKLVESITLISEGQVPNHIYEEATQYLTDLQIIAIEWLTIVINSWNRIAISSRYRVQP